MENLIISFIKQMSFEIHEIFFIVSNVAILFGVKLIQNGGRKTAWLRVAMCLMRDD